MKAKSLVLLVLALGCGLVASIGITQVMAKRNRDTATPTGESSAIFVAMNDIPMGDPITAQVIKLEDWPKDKVPAGALSRIEDVEGRRPRGKIYAGSPIMENQLLSKGASDTATGRIPKGFRVVPVKVDAVSGAGGLVMPSDRVDVLVHLQRNPSRGILETKTVTILQDIMVFAVGKVFDLEETEGDKSITAKTVSLLVTPEQAETVMLASELGKIRLIMRGSDDKEHANVSGASPHLLSGGAAPGDRQKENPPAAEPEPKDDSGFGGFLKSMQQKSEVAQPASQVPEESSTWDVRILAGTNVEDVTLESPAEPAAANSNFQVWKSSGSSGLSGNDRAVDNTVEGSDATATTTEDEEDEKDPAEEDPAEEDEDSEN